jgi:hypothetical protein
VWSKGEVAHEKQFTVGSIHVDVEFWIRKVNMQGRKAGVTHMLATALDGNWLRCAFETCPDSDAYSMAGSICVFLFCVEATD